MNIILSRREWTNSPFVPYAPIANRNLAVLIWRHRVTYRTAVWLRSKQLRRIQRLRASGVGGEVARHVVTAW